MIIMIVIITIKKCPYLARKGRKYKECNYYPHPPHSHSHSLPRPISIPSHPILSHPIPISLLSCLARSLELVLSCLVLSIFCLIIQTPRIIKRLEIVCSYCMHYYFPGSISFNSFSCASHSTSTPTFCQFNLIQSFKSFISHTSHSIILCQSNITTTLIERHFAYNQFLQTERNSIQPSNIFLHLLN